MWFKNKKTGLEWKIEDESLVRRLERDPDYEAVKKRQPRTAKTEKVKE